MRAPAIVLSLLLSAPAWAANVVLPGSPAALFLHDATVTNAQLDDLGQFAQQGLWPAMGERSNTWTSQAKTTYLGGLLRVPTDLGSSCDDSVIATCPFVSTRADGYLAHAGVGYRWDAFGVFYAADFFGLRTADSPAYPLSAIGSSVLAVVNTPLAPMTSGLLRIHNFNAMAWGFSGWGAQYLLGGTAQAAGVQGRVAFTSGTGGHGFMVSAAMPSQGLEGALLWRPWVGDVAYAWIGLRHAKVLSWLFPDTLDLPATTTSLFLKVQSWAVPPGTLPPPGPQGTSLFTIALQQHAIPMPLGILEARLGLGVHPAVFLQEAAVSWHTAQPGAILDLGISLGVVAQPTMHYFAIAGGARFYAAAQLSWEKYGWISLEENPADMLTRLPFAQAMTTLNLHVNFDAFDDNG